MLLDVLAPHYYPKAGTGAERPPVGLERMLRMYFLRQWFPLADEALEDAIYDSQAFLAFLGIDLGGSRCPTPPICCGSAGGWRTTISPGASSRPSRICCAAVGCCW
jgi:hypothetical protein